MMDTFSKAGEAMLLAEEGNRLLAQALVNAVRGWVGSFKTWLRAMPTSLPPTGLPR